MRATSELEASAIAAAAGAYGATQRTGDVTPEARALNAPLISGGDLMRPESTRHEASDSPMHTSLPSTNHYRAIVESSDDAIVAKSIDGTVLSWNPAAQRIFGYSAEEMLGRPITKLFPPDRVHEEADILARIIKGERIEHLETVRLRRCGQRIDVSATISPIADDAGRIIGASKIARDITKRADAQRVVAALNREARELAAIVKSSDDAIISKTPQGIVTSWNPAAERIFGYAASQMIDKPITVVFPTDRLKEEAFLLDMIRKGERVRHFETERMHRDGRRVNLSVTLSPIHDSDGELVGISKIARDITERVQAERQIWHEANHDPLTDLPNRRLFMSRLSDEFAKPHATRFGVMYMDLDGFKQVNDTLGHDAGDSLLRMAAFRIQQCLRESDIVARLGGDEFVALLPGVSSATSVEQLANRIVRSLREPFMLQEQAVAVSVSIGIAMFPEDGRSMDALLTLADEALYSAKRGGRNQYRTHRDGPA